MLQVKHLESQTLKEQFDRNGFIVMNAFGLAQLKDIQTAAKRELSEQLKPFELEADVQYPGAPKMRRLAEDLLRDDFCEHSLGIKYLPNGRQTQPSLIL